MERILLVLGVSLLASGCVPTSAGLRAQAVKHERRANDFAAVGSYGRANREQRKADKLNRAAIDRQSQDATDVTNL